MSEITSNLAIHSGSSGSKPHNEVSKYHETMHGIKNGFVESVKGELGQNFQGFFPDHPLTPDDRQDLTSKLVHLSKFVNKHVINLVGIPIEVASAQETRENTLESCLSTVFQAFNDEDGTIQEMFPTPFEMAARIVTGITRQHPFLSGNKRTGLYTSMLFLNDAGFSLPTNYDPDEIYSFFKALSVGTVIQVEGLTTKPLSDVDTLHRMMYLWDYQPENRSDEEWQKRQDVLGERIGKLATWANKQQAIQDGTIAA